MDDATEGHQPADRRRRWRQGVSIAMLIVGLGLVLVARVLGGMRGGEYSSASDVGSGSVQLLGYVLVFMAVLTAASVPRRRDRRFGRHRAS